MRATSHSSSDTLRTGSSKDRSKSRNGSSPLHGCAWSTKRSFAPRIPLELAIWAKAADIATLRRFCRAHSNHIPVASAGDALSGGNGVGRPLASPRTSAWQLKFAVASAPVLKHRGRKSSTLGDRSRKVEQVTVNTILPTARRDLRLDLFRGLANWLIFLGHVPDTALTWFTTRNYGFSDAADLFVFISGYTAAFVFARVMIERGFLIGATRLLRRVWQLYVAQLLLFLFYVTGVHYLAHTFDNPHLMDEFNVANLMEFPVEVLTQGLALRFKPLNLDVLPLYIVLMAAFAPVLWLMLRYRNAVMFGSILLYVAARHFSWNFQSYPSGVWYFNPFAWQLLFVLGAWLALGGARTVRDLAASRLVVVLSIGFLFFSLAVTLGVRFPDLKQAFSPYLLENFYPNDKTNLAPYRVLHLASLVVLVVHFVPIDWPGLNWWILRPLIKCGQRSLPVFCIGIFLSFVAHFVLETVSDSLPVQLLVGLTGISIMTAVAYYQSWSKQVDKRTSPIQIVDLADSRVPHRRLADAPEQSTLRRAAR